MAQPSPQDAVIERQPVDRSPVVGVAATPRRGADTFTRRPRRTVPAWAVLAVCCMAQFIVVLDISIVNVALPQKRSGAASLARRPAVGN